MARSRTGRRWGLRAASACAPLLATACWGAEPPRVASPVVQRTAAPSHAASRAGSGAILSDADLAAIGSPQLLQAPAVADAPLPPEIVTVLQRRPGYSPVDASHDLAISFGDSRRDVFETALDAASVLDDALPPASPAPDLP